MASDQQGGNCMGMFISGFLAGGLFGFVVTTILMCGGDE